MGKKPISLKSFVSENILRGKIFYSETNGALICNCEIKGLA
jgi:hypothetical protein